MVEAINTGKKVTVKAAESAWRIAVLIPCFNEGATIGKVIRDFQEVLPTADIYVFDNNSTDETVETAKAHNATVMQESRQGKGHVVRRMFAAVDADIFVLVDGDDTYDASLAPRLVETLIDGGLDMVTGTRQSSGAAAFRRGHRFGNWLMTFMVRSIFDKSVSDMLSGYRVFSRRFVKSFPVRSRGFEIETEITVHALSLQMPVQDIAVPYRERPSGSSSKLNTFGDGARILSTIFNLVRDERPLMFFSLAAAALFGIALFLAWPVLQTFLADGEVPRFPTAILAMGLVGLAFLSLACGLILDSVSRGRRELKYLNYLRVPPLRSERSREPKTPS